jgi:WD40 repeat protein
VIAVAFAPDGRSLTSVAPRARPVFQGLVFHKWDLSTVQPRTCFTILWGSPSTFSRDGRVAAIARMDLKLIELWDVETAHLLSRAFRHSAVVRLLALSPDARLLATTTGDHFVSLWSVATGRELRRLDGQTDVIRHIAFSPGGKTLAACGSDSDILLWDLDGAIDSDVRP